MFIRDKQITDLAINLATEIEYIKFLDFHRTNTGIINGAVFSTFDSDKEDVVIYFQNHANPKDNSVFLSITDSDTNKESGFACDLDADDIADTLNAYYFNVLP